MEFRIDIHIRWMVFTKLIVGPLTENNGVFVYEGDYKSIQPRKR